MQVAKREERMAAIVALTQVMQQHTSDGNWDDVCALQEQRERLVREFFAVSVTTEERMWVAQMIEHIIRMDQDIESKCRAEMETVSTQMQGLARGRDARAAYQNIGE